MKNDSFVSTVVIEWSPEEFQGTVNEADNGTLHQYGFEHALSMINDGLREGEMSISVMNSDGKTPYRGSWTYRESSPGDERKYSLPFGIEIKLSNDGAGQMSSDLPKQFMLEGKIDEKGEASAEALESLLLAMACEGVDLSCPKFQKALETAVQAIGDEMDDEISPEATSSQQIDWSQPMPEIRKQIRQQMKNDSETGQAGVNPQRLMTEDAGGPWGYVYCIFRTWRGEYHMDIERRVTVPKDFEGWRDCFDAECRSLKNLWGYDSVEFVSICQA